ncbi:MAG TPA: prepilin peptidase [Pirellulales bacterium]|jgi:leader peptidase (prepilin peptidase)/N-methyltransferase|nr:prepilin peptidase [Pirellulales bacterium]
MIFADSTVTDPAQAWSLAVLMFFIGASIGSFLNVVVYRVPAGMSIVRPGSRCPNCRTPIRSTDNLPIIGWLRLRGRCRSCGEPIARRYPLVELCTAVMFFVLAWLEWPAGGVNLPGPSLDETQRYGMFAYHAALVCLLLVATLVEYDGHAVPKLMAVVGLGAILLGGAWPMLHPVSPPFSAMRELVTGPPRVIGLADGMGGWLAGIVMGCLASPVTDRGPSGAVGRNTAILAMAVTGAFLGWQALAALAAASVLVYAVAVMYRPAWRRLAGIPYSGVLFALVFAWLCGWREIVERWPRLGSEADHWTIGIAGLAAVGAAATAHAVSRTKVI